MISFVAVSITSSAPGDCAMATYTLRPSGVAAMLLGRPLRGIFFVTFSIATSTTSTVLSDFVGDIDRSPVG